MKTHLCSISLFILRFSKTTLEDVEDEVILEDEDEDISDLDEEIIE